MTYLVVAYCFVAFIVFITYEVVDMFYLGDADARPSSVWKKAMVSTAWPTYFVARLVCSACKLFKA